MKEILIGYDVASPDSDDNSCLVQFCGNCNSFIKVDNIAELEGVTSEQRLQSIKEKEVLEECPECGISFKNKIYQGNYGIHKIEILKQRK